jgi:RNA polymerase sigma-70 factor (ECF subfamily)
MGEEAVSRDALSARSGADPASTIELIERARTGDRSALDLLFTRHFRPLRRWASGRLPRWARDVTDTDDLVQDALLQTFKRLDDFDARGTGALYAYLRQAVLNRVRDELRRKARRPPADALADREADPGLSPLEQAIGSQALERYERALARLRPEEQETLVARLEMGCTYQEVAESLGKPSAEAARKAAQRALVRLIAEMDQLASG